MQKTGESVCLSGGSEPRENNHKNKFAKEEAEVTFVVGIGIVIGRGRKRKTGVSASPAVRGEEGNYPPLHSG